jgi:DNA-binding NarL/FixJ family response regulator
MTSTGPLRVLIVEDHGLLAQSVGMALEAEGHQVLVSALASVAGVLEEARALQPSVVLLDLDLGGTVGDGLGLVTPLRRAGARVLVVTGSTEEHRHGMCLEQGAAGVMDKRTSFDRLLHAVVVTGEGGSPIDEARRLGLLAAVRAWRGAEVKRLEPFERLTPRERQVLGELMAGSSAEAIASSWFVSEATVRTQIRGVLTKLGVTSQLAAVAAARTAGWVPGEES